MVGSEELTRALRVDFEDKLAVGRHAPRIIRSQ
jgi:hypothetical protein